ncbi:MAG: glycoside hydrolase family 9 protein [Acidobacteriota bacterium]
MQLSLNHLGYLPRSPKTLTLLADDRNGLPEVIPFYLRQNCLRMSRDGAAVEGFSARFPSPYDLLRGKLVPSSGVQPLYRGELRKISSRWGTLWQADFTDFETPGSYQIETDWQISPPFAIRERVYDRIVAGYLTFLRAQRCGCAVFGVHDACHLDDGILDTDGSPLQTTGGWHDAGDFRKWLAFTLCHIEALLTIREQAGDDLETGGVGRDLLLEEVAWGNTYFHRMMGPDGQVYEDVAGGNSPPGSALSYEKDWWFENHPGCYGDPSDNRFTDNIPGSGDERKIRTTYNPLVQWSFVQAQARASKHLSAPQAGVCLQHARRAAAFARRQGHDRRTLFLAAELRGALELLAAGDESTDRAAIETAACELMRRQVNEPEGLSGYFTENHGSDAFRSIAFAADPAFALLRFWELRSMVGETPITGQARQAVVDYIEKYLLADAGSNPFSLTPYGVYSDPPHPDRQYFRNAGRGQGVRTFMHPFNAQGIVHGSSSVLMSHAHLLARAAALLAEPQWRGPAERLLHWCLGHNVRNRSLFSGIGYRQPVGYSFRIPQIPEAMVVGFIGRPDDSPYVEESTAIEWNTLEYWSIPFVHAAQAACWLRR